MSLDSSFELIIFSIVKSLKNSFQEANSRFEQLKDSGGDLTVKTLNFMTKDEEMTNIKYGISILDGYLNSNVMDIFVSSNQLTPERKRELLTLLPLAEEMKKVFEDSKNKFFLISSQKFEDYKAPVARLIGTANEFLTAANDIMGEDVKNETAKNIRKRRSELMHKAANERSDKDERGVWKIGETHVKDIQEQHPNPNDRKYNLVNQQDFDADLQKNKDLIFRKKLEAKKRELDEAKK